MVTPDTAPTPGHPDRCSCGECAFRSNDPRGASEWLEAAEDHYFDAMMADAALREAYALPASSAAGRDRAARLAAMHQQIGFSLKAGALAAQLAIAAADVVLTHDEVHVYTTETPLSPRLVAALEAQIRRGEA